MPFVFVMILTPVVLHYIKIQAYSVKTIRLFLCQKSGEVKYGFNRKIEPYRLFFDEKVRVNFYEDRYERNRFK